jgi:proliferating cell nuclear antigen
MKSIQKIITETSLIISKDGLKIDAIDEGRICICSLFLSAKDFKEYAMDNPIEKRLGINVDDFVSVLDRFKKYDAITLSDEISNKLKITASDENTKKKSELQLIELGDSAVSSNSLKEIFFKNIVELNIDLVEEAIKDAETFSETMQLKFEREGLRFVSEGQLGLMDTFISNENGFLKKYSTEITESGFYSVKYLKDIISIKTFADQIEIRISDKNPMRVQADFSDNSNIIYYLAPRIEEEEEEYEKDEITDEIELEE